MAPGYELIFVEPHKRNEWSADRRQQHVNAFLIFSQSSAGLYTKPAVAGSKEIPPTKRKIEKDDPELFVEGIQTYIFINDNIHGIVRIQLSLWNLVHD